jgi:hypothetical protein
MAKWISPSYASPVVCNYKFVFYELYTNTLCFACQLNQDTFYNGFTHADQGMKEVLHQINEKIGWLFTISRPTWLETMHTYMH